MTSDVSRAAKLPRHCHCRRSVRSLIIKQRSMGRMGPNQNRYGHAGRRTTADPRYGDNRVRTIVRQPALSSANRVRTRRKDVNLQTQHLHRVIIGSLWPSCALDPSRTRLVLRDSLVPADPAQ